MTRPKVLECWLCAAARGEDLRWRSLCDLHKAQEANAPRTIKLDCRRCGRRFIRWSVAPGCERFVRFCNPCRQVNADPLAPVLREAKKVWREKECEG